MTTDELMKAVYNALTEKQGRDITVIDIHEISTLADYFIITHGNNTPHVESLVDCVQETMDKAGAVCKSVEGLRGGRWVLLDYGRRHRRERLLEGRPDVLRSGKDLARRQTC